MRQSQISGDIYKHGASGNSHIYQDNYRFVRMAIKTLVQTCNMSFSDFDEQEGSTTDRSSTTKKWTNPRTTTTTTTTTTTRVTLNAYIAPSNLCNALRVFRCRALQSFNDATE